MKPVETGIAVALAVAVIAAFFIFPQINPFTTAKAGNGGNASSTSLTNIMATSTATTTMQENQTGAQASNTQTLSDGLQITNEKEGTGAVAQPGDMVTVNYVGTLSDGKVFDASANHPQTKDGFTFQLGAGHVIKGWDQGVAGMKVGGERKLVIPPALGYGAQGAGNVIPPNATLTFQVQLLKVQKPSGG